MVPNIPAVRPTPARAREALFSILEHLERADGSGLRGARVLDAFAGTGALGLEALSRGAQRALFLEADGQARHTLTDNLRALNEGENASVLPRDATKPGPAPAQAPFDLIFADAPYGTGMGSQALEALAAENWLLAGALAVIEVEATETLAPPGGFARLDDRTYGRTRLVLLAYG